MDKARRQSARQMRIIADVSNRWMVLRKREKRRGDNMRLIDADALTELIHGMYAEGDDPSTYHVDAEGDTLIGKFAVVDAIFNMPTIQPEIIRCKYCKNYKYGICKKAGLCVNKSPNGFCDWGER